MTVQKMRVWNQVVTLSFSLKLNKKKLFETDNDNELTLTKLKTKLYVLWFVQKSL